MYVYTSRYVDININTDIYYRLHILHTYTYICLMSVIYIFLLLVLLYFLFATVVNLEQLLRLE